MSSYQPEMLLYKKGIRTYRDEISRHDEDEEYEEEIEEEIEEPATKKNSNYLKELSEKILVSYCANSAHKESDQTNLAKMAMIQARIFKTVFQKLGGSHIDLRISTEPVACAFSKESTTDL